MKKLRYALLMSMVASCIAVQAREFDGLDKAEQQALAKQQESQKAELALAQTKRRKDLQEQQEKEAKKQQKEQNKFNAAYHDHAAKVVAKANDEKKIKDERQSKKDAALAQEQLALEQKLEAVKRNRHHAVEQHAQEINTLKNNTFFQVRQFDQPMLWGDRFVAWLQKKLLLEYDITLNVKPKPKLHKPELNIEELNQLFVISEILPEPKQPLIIQKIQQLLPQPEPKSDVDEYYQTHYESEHADALAAVQSQDPKNSDVVVASAPNTLATFNPFTGDFDDQDERVVSPAQVFDFVYPKVLDTAMGKKIGQTIAQRLAQQLDHEKKQQDVSVPANQYSENNASQEYFDVEDDLTANTSSDEPQVASKENGVSLVENFVKQVQRSVMSDDSQTVENFVTEPVQSEVSADQNRSEKNIESVAVVPVVESVPSQSVQKAVPKNPDNVLVKVIPTQVVPTPVVPTNVESKDVKSTVVQPVVEQSDIMKSEVVPSQVVSEQTDQPISELPKNKVAKSDIQTAVAALSVWDQICNFANRYPKMCGIAAATVACGALWYGYKKLTAKKVEDDEQEDDSEEFVAEHEGFEQDLEEQGSVLPMAKQTVMQPKVRMIEAGMQTHEINGVGVQTNFGDDESIFQPKAAKTIQAQKPKNKIKKGSNVWCAKCGKCHVKVI